MKNYNERVQLLEKVLENWQLGREVEDGDRRKTEEEDILEYSAKEERSFMF